MSQDFLHHVRLWADNTETNYRDIQALVEAHSNEGGPYILAADLQGYVADAMLQLDNYDGMAGELLGMALRACDWTEWARDLREEYALNLEA